MHSVIQFLTNPSPQDVILVLVLAIISRLSPAGRWNYKRTKYLRERREKGKWVSKKQWKRLKKK